MKENIKIPSLKSNGKSIISKLSQLTLSRLPLGWPPLLQDLPVSLPLSMGYLVISSRVLNFQSWQEEDQEVLPDQYTED